MLKLAGGILIVICGTFSGIYVSLWLKRKVEFWEQYLIFLVQAQTMIGYGAMSVREILSGVKGVALVEPVLKETQYFLEHGMRLEQAWRKAVERQMKALRFSQSDREVLYTFGELFGVTDVKGELAKIQIHSELVRERARVLKEEFASKSRIYRIVGMFCGVLTAVMIC